MAIFLGGFSKLASEGPGGQVADWSVELVGIARAIPPSQKKVTARYLVDMFRYMFSKGFL